MAAEEHKLDPERRKALSLAISQIEKQLGKGSIMRMGTESRVRVAAIPTGAINLDAAIETAHFIGGVLGRKTPGMVSRAPKWPHA